MLTTGLMITAASCSSLTPLGPDPAATLPPPHHLRSPIVLQATRIQIPGPAGSCPAGYATLPGANLGTCYRKTGTPVTFTSAAASVSASQPEVPGGGTAGPTQYEVLIILPAADAPALTAVSTTAYDAHGALAMSIGGKTWALPLVTHPFPDGWRQLMIMLPDRNQALQLQHLLTPSG
jgi:hypothetical protein